MQANVAKQADVEGLFSETKKAFGRLDLVVNNARHIDGNTKTMIRY